MADDVRLKRFAEAYLQMAREARYRPYYADGSEALDKTITANEALAYARDFAAEDDKQSFNIGCSHYDTSRAFVFLIEAARLLAAGGDDQAIRLATMAVKEIETHGRRDATLL